MIDWLIDWLIDNDFPAGYFCIFSRHPSKASRKNYLSWKNIYIYVFMWRKKCNQLVWSCEIGTIFISSISILYIFHLFHLHNKCNVHIKNRMFRVSGFLLILWKLLTFRKFYFPPENLLKEFLKSKWLIIKLRNYICIHTAGYLVKRVTLCILLICMIKDKLTWNDNDNN